MSGIAASIDWTGARSPRDRVRAMLAAMPHRAPDGSRSEGGQFAAFGFANCATTARQRASEQPFHDPARGLWIVGDVRIDNRRDIASALKIECPASDVELLAQAFARWNGAVAERLIGDFAFAIWNERSRSLYTARDAFGVRPLFYVARAGGIEIASEVDALLAAESTSHAIDLLHLAEFAGGSIGDAGRTMYASIRRLPMGHALFAREGCVFTRRWHVYPKESALRDAQTDVEAFRAAFLQSVGDRLDADRTVYSQLSGGLDSSSIACAAGVIRQREPETTPTIVLASATYPGLRCDESVEIDAVLKRVPFANVRWRFDDPRLAALDPIARSTPWRDVQPGASAHSIEIARRNGSRVVLTGQGGDELLHEHGAYTDLARAGRIVTLYRETIGSDLYLSNPGRHYFEQAVRMAIPAPLRALRRALRPRATLMKPPRWFGRRLAEQWMSRRTAQPVRDAPSHLAGLTWSWLNSPTGSVYRDIDELMAAQRGVELRHPFLDRRLAGVVLSIPWERRLVRGRMKALLRDAMADELPPIIAQRRQVTTFEQAVVAAVRAQMDLLEKTMNSKWTGSEIVDRTVARELFAKVHRDGTSASYEDCYDLWSAASIELWIRTLEQGYGES